MSYMHEHPQGGTGGWDEVPSDVCTHFQVDLSCLVDGELDEAAAGRAMVHLEDCGSCRSFFEDTRTQLRVHRDMADPERLFARIAMLTGGDLQAEVEGVELVHRLATVFYQLGKAYVLKAIDPGFAQRVWEKAVSVDSTCSHGRGFVDGVLLGGKDKVGGVDWNRARTMLNGRLERIATPLEKGRRLLREAVEADPSHEEAQLYLAFLEAHQGRKLAAAEEYRRILNTAVEETNRGHAAMQLGLLYHSEDSFRKALVPWRWLTISGVADLDERFFWVRFNIASAYAFLRNRTRSLEYFRAVLDRSPERAGELAEVLAGSEDLRQTIESQPGFSEELLVTCPELFTGSAHGGTADDDLVGPEEIL